MDLPEHFPCPVLVVEGIPNHLDGHFLPIALVLCTDDLAEAAFTADFLEFVVDLRVPPNLRELGEFTPLVLEEPGPVWVIRAFLIEELIL